ncbi:hypothetical protein DLAC_09106 [Tieghemostelium lacteum]|uniref:Uncharacterized protein n=1 Tax=Tieghemostelium lacteum TaxID=361077 RepID=A0A151Z957_TIELA|nr:hypothetical protein DLAC_09106 [Tieghemostelium lacteum]|eukprot:KYQ90481.1 hypothetical protein DLAC_09106 [Tieghemostelium lacteum]
MSSQTINYSYLLTTSLNSPYKKLTDQQNIVYHFSITDDIIEPILKDKNNYTPTIRYFQEEYIDSKDFKLMASGTWAKYQDGKLVVKKTQNLGDGYLAINLLKEEEAKTTISKDMVPYASFFVKRYKFSLVNDITLYIDCAFYEDKVALYGSAKTLARESNFLKLCDLIRVYQNPTAVQRKIIHYLSLSKRVDLPSTSKNDLISPQLKDCDPFQDAYFNIKIN